MALTKLKIYVESQADPLKFDELNPIEALFNPNLITIQKSSTWRLAATVGRDVAKSQFTYGEPATLTMDLFFDTYGETRQDKRDVRKHTNRIFHLTTVQEHGHLHRPPLCRLDWGTFTFPDFHWVLQSLNQRFTLFLQDGTPVRTTLTCTFRQWRSDDLEAKLLNQQSVDVAKTRTVRQGDTLSSIASEEYNDSTLWRPIAEANRIDNPRALKPGQVLSIPVLRSSSTTQR